MSWSHSLPYVDGLYSHFMADSFLYRALYIWAAPQENYSFREQVFLLSKANLGSVLIFAVPAAKEG